LRKRRTWVRGVAQKHEEMETKSAFNRVLLCRGDVYWGSNQCNSFALLSV
jgi:hypothetical protein